MDSGVSHSEVRDDFPWKVSTKTRAALMSKFFCNPGSIGYNISDFDLTRLLRRSRLCELCKNMTRKDLRRRSGYRHAANFADLETSAHNCYLCWLISRAIIRSVKYNFELEHIIDLQDAEEELVNRWVQKGLVPPTSREIRIRRNPDDELQMIVDVKTALASAEPYIDEHGRDDQFTPYLLLHTDRPAYPPPVSTRAAVPDLLDEVDFTLFGEAGVDSIADSVLPNRILDLEDWWDVDKGPRMRLIATEGRLKGKYAALSYCWGNFRGCITKTTSLQNRCEGIIANELPQIFRDAGFVARYLGLRYLWIDALCILQDDIDDWENEAAQMASIFRNCVVRLAATSAEDPRGSLFPQQAAVPSLRFKQFERSEEQVKWYFSLPRRYRRDVDYARLNSRAWVLQERLLPSRTIHFCYDHIYTETETWGKVGEDLLPEHGARFTGISKSGVSRNNLMQTRVTNSMHHGSYESTDDPSDSWLRISELYSQCSITFESDKLVALSGLIKDRQELGHFPYKGSENYLGAWDTTLHEDLLWARTGKTLTLLDNLNLSTWAWIAYKGPVEFLKERRCLREPRTVRTSPIREFDILGVEHHTHSFRLPLVRPVILNMRLRLAKVPHVSGTRLKRPADGNVDLREGRPFNYSSQLLSRPIPLLCYNENVILENDDGDCLGFGIMDTDEEPNSLDLWCAQIATVHNENYDGPDPLSRMPRLAITTVGRGYRSQNTSEDETFDESLGTRILTYCLLVSRVKEGAQEFRRRGVAELKCGWVDRAPKETISLV